MINTALLNRLVGMPNQRRIVLVFSMLAALLAGKLLWIDTEAKKRLHAQTRLHDLQRLLNESTLNNSHEKANNNAIPELKTELKLTHFSTHNGTQNYIVEGSFAELYHWLQEFYDSQWYPQEASMQWLGETIELRLALVAGEHRIAQLPESQGSPFPALQTPEPEPLPSCLDWWPESSKLVAILGNKAVINNGQQAKVYWPGDVHQESGLLLADITGSKIVLSSRVTEALALEPSCVSATVSVNESSASKPRWLP